MMLLNMIVLLTSLHQKMASQANSRNFSADTTAKGLKRKSQELSSDESSYYDPSTEDDSESEPDCDDYDRNCKVIVATTIKNVLHGFHLMPTCLPEPEHDPSKSRVPKISASLKLFTNDFIQKWSQGIACKDHNVQIIAEPWKACVVDGLLDDELFLHDVCQEFYELSWNRRRMDLYDFHQSLDLKYVNANYIKSTYEFLKNEVMPWVSKIMQVDLKTISATCSFYTDTDYLLVHDDQQDDRVVAFVLYLSDVRPWDETWGGALQLLDRDENGQPRRSQHEIYPKHNRLVLFPVSNITYHQVDEVTTKNFCRLSINGWFHGEVIPSKQTVKYVPPLDGLYGSTRITAAPISVDLNRWVNNDYLKTRTIIQIQEHVEEHSEISLEDFFDEKRFRGVLDALRRTHCWKVVGPPNRFRYEVLDMQNASADVSEFIDVFKSKEMFDLLQKYTDLDLGSDGATIRFELQRWMPGCYSLLSDYEWNRCQELDIVVFLGCRGVVGGQTQYISQDEEIHQALITLEPKDNTLNVVYRDTARITGYVSKHTKLEFYVLLCSYMEPKTK